MASVNDFKEFVVAISKLFVDVDSKVPDDSETEKLVRANIEKVFVGAQQVERRCVDVEETINITKVGKNFVKMRYL